MKILSFDVGIVNLAYCIIETDESINKNNVSNKNPVKILHWEVISLENIKDHAKLYINLISELDKRLPILINGINIVLIEKQPSFNPKMRIIAGCLQTYFFIRGIVDIPHSENKIKIIKFYSPKNKLKCYTSDEQLEVSGSNKYIQTKKLGIIICEKKLIEYSEDPQFINYFKSSKKKDDLSDCYLQALTYFLESKKMINLKNNIKYTTVKRVSKKELKEKFKEYINNLLINNITNQEIIDNINNNTNNTFSFKNDLLNTFKITYPLTPESLKNLLKQLNLVKYLSLRLNVE